MKKKSYKLQTVLELREEARVRAASALAQHRARLAQAETELRRREEAVLDCRALALAARQRHEATLTSGTAAASLLMSHRTHLADLRAEETRLQRLVVKQREVIARAETEVQQALEALEKAARELQAIEKHRESWRAEARREESRREQKLSDEIGALLHARRQSE